jgi:hypothetical protein
VQSSFSQTAARLSGRDLFLADEANAGARLNEISDALAGALPNASSICAA